MQLVAERVNVAWRDAPFTGRPRMMRLPQGLSCAEIIAQVPSIDTQRFLRQGVFCINGEPVPRDMWAFVRPKAREDLCVTLHMPIRGGGGGGGKDTLRIVAAIALLAVATAITGGALEAFGAAFAAGQLGAQIAAGVVTIAGALLLGAFVKPPSASQPKTSNEVEGQPASLQGNVLKRGESVPRVVGTMRVYPPFLSQPLIDLIEYDEVIEATYGLAGPHYLDRLRFGDIFLDEIDLNQLTYEIIELSDEDNGIDSNVVVMLHLDGIQDSVDFPDSGPLDVAFSYSGAVFIDKDSKWFGLAAAFFAGSDSMIISPPIAAMGIVDHPFSIDFWFEYDGQLGIEARLAGHCGTDLAAGDSGWYIRMNSAGTIDALLSDGVTFTTISTTSKVTTGRHHYAISRDANGIVRAYIDGVKQSGDVSFASAIPLPTNGFTLGSAGQSIVTSTWNGWIDEFRWVIGSDSGYTGNTFNLRRTPYRLATPDLISRYGKTVNPAILMDTHKIKNPTSATQPTRDNLANQNVPQRSLPQPQSVVARGTGMDEAWVTLSFTAGLAYTDTNFDPTWFNAIPFRIRVRSVGTNTWFNLPEVHIHDRRQALFSRKLVFRWDSMTVIPGHVPNITPLLQKAWKAAYYTVPTQTVTPVGIGGWQADPHFFAGSGDTYFTGDNFATTGLRNINLKEESVDFFLDGLVDKGPIEIEIKRGQLYIADKFVYSTYNLNVALPADGLSNGIFDLFGYAVLAGNDIIILKQSNGAQDVQINRVATVWNSPPIARTGEFAAVYVKARGRRLDALSSIASGLVADWNGTEWTGLNATSNPAPHYRDVLVGNLNDNAIPESMVDDDVLLEWRQRCFDLEFECNAVFNGENVDRVLDTISSCGYARTRQSETWDVAQDRDFTNIPPVQVFTPRNMNNFRWEKAFIRHRPDALRVKYSDVTDDYNEHTIVVPRLGQFTETGRMEEIRYDGLVTLEEVVFKAIYDQQQVIDRFTFYYGQVDVENLVCRRGDLVVVQHDTLDQFAGFSRILSVEIDGGEVSSFELDGSVSPVDVFFLDSPTFFTQPTDFFTSDCGVCVRQKDGTLKVFSAAVSSNGFTLTPTPALTGIDAEVFERECLVTTGRLLRENRRMLVYDVRPNKNLVADITFVDEAPQLWQFPEPVQVEEDFMRNKIINGDMRLDQRNAGAAVTPPNLTTTYTVDRVFAFNGDSVGSTSRFTVQQLATGSPPATFSDYLRATVISQVTPLPANDRYFFGYIFSEDDILDLDWGLSTGRQVALSFMVRASVTGTYSGAISNAADNAVYPFTFTVPVANTWLRRVITFPAPPVGYDFTGTDKGLTLRISLGLGTSQSSTADNQWQSGTARGVTNTINLVETLGATFDITGLQFELAPATQFERLPIAFVQQQAYRFCQVFRGPTLSDKKFLGHGFALDANTARVVVALLGPMRNDTPVSVTVINSPLGFELARQGSAIASVTSLSSLSPEVSSNIGITFDAASSGLTAGEGLVLRGNRDGVIIVDGELY